VEEVPAYAVSQLEIQEQYRGQKNREFQLGWGNERNLSILVLRD